MKDISYQGGVKSCNFLTIQEHCWLYQRISQNERGIYFYCLTVQDMLNNVICII